MISRVSSRGFDLGRSKNQLSKILFFFFNFYVLELLQTILVIPQNEIIANKNQWDFIG